MSDETKAEKKLPMVVQQNTGIAINTIDDLNRAAQMFLKSGMFSEKSGEADLCKAMVKMVAGQEMGLRPFQAMRGIDIVQGTPMFKYQLVGAKIKQSGRYDYKIVESTETCAKIQFFDDGQPCFMSIFTFEMAAKRGLAGKDNYKKQPNVMLLARALTQGANIVCPEIFFGAVHAPEDFGHSSDRPLTQADIESIEAESWATNDTPTIQKAVTTKPETKKRNVGAVNDQSNSTSTKSNSGTSADAKTATETTTDPKPPVETGTATDATGDADPNESATDSEAEDAEIVDAEETTTQEAASAEGKPDANSSTQTATSTGSQSGQESNQAGATDSNPAPGTTRMRFNQK